MPEPAAAPSRPLAIALAGLVSLAVAMGIGRFAFTPLLPMMLAEHSVTLAGASLLASANYFGYLVGALACTFQPWIWQRIGRPAAVNGPRLVRAGLVATVLLTLGMALHFSAAWVLLRFAAGVASGLAASALVAAGAQAAAGWLTFGVLAALLTASVWGVFDRRRGIAAAPVGAGAGASGPEAVRVGAGYMGVLSLAYGLAGMGYIVTATFLPVIARQALPGSHWLDLFWPLFGVGVMLGAIGASRLPARGDLRLRLAACYAVQAAGVAASLVSPTLAGFALGSLLLGLPFTAITFFGMQEVRRVRPRQATSYMGLLTAVYGVGQIAGPPLAAWLVAHSASAAQGFAVALWIACGLLGFGAVLYLGLARKR